MPIFAGVSKKSGNMKHLRAYAINFLSLADGQHQFDYELNEKFLSAFEDTPLNQAQVVVKLQMLKKQQFMQLDFQLSGHVPAQCDLCGQDFDLPIALDEQMIVKFVHELPELPEPELIYLQHGASQLDLANTLYELLVLAIPIRKVHPNEGCPAEILDLLDQYSQITEEEEEEDETPNSSVWDALKDLDLE